MTDTNRDRDDDRRDDRTHIEHHRGGTGARNVEEPPPSHTPEAEHPEPGWSNAQAVRSEEVGVPMGERRPRPDQGLPPEHGRPGHELPPEQVRPGHELPDHAEPRGRDERAPR